ncbi:hypothetical protein BJ742DRAFT_743450 [Cladochytrium replicatum]|nr:hypothetical protein BJ742DRAFT_743450 [Cladochytrium replicatum]
MLKRTACLLVHWAADKISVQTQTAAKSTVKLLTPDTVPSTPRSVVKELEEAAFTIERKSNELRQARDDFAKLQQSAEQQKLITEQLEKDLAQVSSDLSELKAIHAACAPPELPASTNQPTLEASEEAEVLRTQLKAADATIQQQKHQIIQVAMDSSAKFNDQQNQIQGLEALVSGVRREYEEFIQITTLENETFRATQQAEYEALRSNFDTYKADQAEEKKKLMAEQQGLLYSMQAQFDEYRATAEYLFGVDLAKLEDELASQSTRYEQEIIYIIQAKDKFYLDMMVSKDAKIMSLIEGADLQSLMQKHEMDIENLRKDHARDIERIKSDQESEQKNLMSLLQRQNVSLESKCDKLQAHLKTLEGRTKELMSTIDAKNKQISEKEEARAKMEADYLKRLDEASGRINALTQEKEHLRHKVIRLNLDARGEGDNTIENMIKRISRETADLSKEFADLSIQHDRTVEENQTLLKKVKERERMIDYLEKEIQRRNNEYSSMTTTFEDFLHRRASRTHKDRARRFLKLYGVSEEAKIVDEKLMEGSNDRAKAVLNTSTNGNVLVKSTIPTTSKSTRSSIPSRTQTAATASKEGSERADLERGYAYLRRFKTLSRAFASGDFRTIPQQPSHDVVQGPWQKINLYQKLEAANLALGRFYKEVPSTELAKQLPSIKPLLYSTDEKAWF